MNCEFCQSPVHVWFQCPKKPDGWKPARLAKVRISTPSPDRPVTPKSDVSASPPSDSKVHTQSTAARKDVQPTGSVVAKSPMSAADVPKSAMLRLPAGNQALPVDTIRKPGRPKTGFNKTLYNREYMRKRRASSRAS